MTFALFLLVSLGTLFIVSKLIPSMYTNSLNRNIDSLIESRLLEFEKKKDINDCIDILKELEMNEKQVYWIHDNKGKMLYSSNNSFKELNSYENYFNQVNAMTESKSVSQYSFLLKDNTLYTLTVETNLSEVTQLKAIILNIFPYMLLLDLVISLLCSLGYTRYISKPILKLSESSQKMADMNFEVVKELKRSDEIGILSKNLNFLSYTLQHKIEELNVANAMLKSDIDRKRELEQFRMTFFSATSHELKTPVTILKGHLNGMLDQVGNYRDRDKYLKRSIVVTEQMEILIKELLYVAKLVGDRKSVSFKEEDLAEIVRFELSNIIHLIEEKNLVLEMAIPEHLMCGLDKTIIHTVLQNLMMNAVQYTPINEKIKIKLSQDNKCVCFKIENTGISIPSGSLDKIFDAFYKVDDARSGGGTGLGLYIVRELLEKHQAIYRIYNTDAGVEFEFLLKE